MFLKPSTHVQHLFGDLTDVDDRALLRTLAEPYRTDDEDGQGRDFNLGSRPAWLATVLDAAAFRTLCRDAQRKGLKRLLEDPDLRALADRAAKAAARDGARRAKRMRISTRAEAEMDDAVTAAVTHPKYRLDSVGIFIVAGYIPKVRAA